MLQAISIKRSRLLNSDVLVNDGCQINLNDITQGNRIADVLHVTIVSDCSSVFIFPIKYAVGDSVVFERDDEGLPQIGKIPHVFVHHPYVCFRMHMYNVENVDEHFHSWKVTIDKDPKVKNAIFTTPFDII